MEKRYDDVAIYTTATAKKLLKLGYVIVNMSENKKEKGRTVFYFKNEKGIFQDLEAILKG